MKLALELFEYQVSRNKVYFEFISALKKNPAEVKSISEIPFLPIEFFKSHKVSSGESPPETIFSSSGTTGETPSLHYIYDTDFYEKIFTEIFNSFYGDLREYTIVALLPSYLEREGSSLVYMMQRLIALTNSDDSGFYLHDHKKLFEVLSRLKSRKKKTILFGVTFGLLDFIASYQINFPELIVMETGGMKGRRKEMVREELHALLCRGFGVKEIHSEYGMTELLSQAYSKGDGIFHTPPWMKVMIRDPYDPLKNLKDGESGGINIIDLANIDSCAFIATQDLGKVKDNSFEVLGRFDFAELRGCNLLVD